jgi:hypothetical protein
MWKVQHGRVFHGAERESYSSLWWDLSELGNKKSVKFKVTVEDLKLARLQCHKSYCLAYFMIIYFSQTNTCEYCKPIFFCVGENFVRFARSLLL